MHLPFHLSIRNSIVVAWSENGESIQILHYQNGEKYEPHYDYFHDKNNQALGGHRIATVLMYLSNVEKGGETIFPNAEVITLSLLCSFLKNIVCNNLNIPQGKMLQPKDDTWSECARNGYAGTSDVSDKTEVTLHIYMLYDLDQLLPNMLWSMTLF